jgi:hypothetical protein
MPFQSDEYTPPSLPEVNSNLRTFEDVRSAVGKIMEYLQRVQAAHVLYFQHLRENLNQSATTQGPDIASAPTITVTKFMHVVTGTATVQNIIAPRHFRGQLMLISRDGFSVATGGNIQLMTSPNYLAANAHILLTYVPSLQLWFADTCRLTNTATTLRIAGHDVETT